MKIIVSALRIISIVSECLLIIAAAIFSRSALAQMSVQEKVVIQANSLMWKKDFAGADKILSALLASEIPNLQDKAKALHSRAGARQALGRERDAIEDAQKADELLTKLIISNSSDDYLHFLRGMTRRIAKNYSGSLADLEIAAKAQPLNSDLAKEIEETKKLMQSR